MNPLANRTSGSLRRLRRSEDGVAATEFSLVAPVLFFCCLATVDVGMALNERMTIDHVLRAGAQSAMTNPGPEHVRDVMEETAKGSDFTVNVVSSTDNAHASASSESLTIAAERYHACPDDPDVKVSPNSCGGTDPSTYTYYRMTAAKIYEAMIIPNMTFAPAMTVQVR